MDDKQLLSEIDKKIDNAISRSKHEFGSVLERKLDAIIHGSEAREAEGFVPLVKKIEDSGNSGKEALSLVEVQNEIIRNQGRTIRFALVAIGIGFLQSFAHWIVTLAQFFSRLGG